MKRAILAFCLILFGQIIFAQLIEEGSVWKYLDDGSDQGTTWQQPGFDDSSWAEGPAQLGYGDNDEATVLKWGDDSSNKYITYYFQKTFNVSDPQEKPILKAGLVRDDGAVVYINGTEVFRANMPDGDINYTTNASQAVAGDSENLFYSYEFPASVLHAGENTIAVEIHQRSKTSSDISFDLRLDFTEFSVFKKEPYLLFAGDNTQMLIVWQMDSTRTCQLDWGTDTTYSAGSANTEEYGDDHQHKILITGLTPDTKYFYRISCERLAIKKGSFVTGVSGDVSQISFYAYGDTRTNPGTHNLVAEKIVQEITQHPETQTFIISTGDLVANGNNENDWQEQFFSSDFGHIRQMMSLLPYVATMGNHEGQGHLFKKYFPYPMFVSNRHYYSFDYGPAHFTIIDQFTDYDEGSPQYEWLVNDLATSDKHWKFILLHEPGWSAGGGHANNGKVQRLIQPLCEMYGVQFVLAGHNHYYARAVVNGVNHITAGGGGAPLYNPNPDASNIVIVSKTNNYCRIDIAGDTLTFIATDKDGNQIETFNRPLNPEAVTESPAQDYFPIYASGKSIIINNKRDKKGRLNIYDTNGRNIFDKKLAKGENQMQVDSTGIYFVRIVYEKYKSTVKKVFVK